MEDTDEIAAGDTADIPSPNVTSCEAVELSCSTSLREQTADLIFTEKNGNAHHFTIPLEQLRKLYVKIDEACRNDPRFFDAVGALHRMARLTGAAGDHRETDVLTISPEN
jgi:hypothetical protein